MAESLPVPEQSLTVPEEGNPQMSTSADNRECPVGECQGTKNQINEKMATGGDLKTTFKEFASVGNGAEATSKDMTRWLKDAKIYGTKCNNNHSDIAFSKTKQKAKRNLTVNELDAFIVELAKMYKLDKKCDDNTAIERIKTDLTGASKKTHGTTKISAAGGVDRMTDASKYTGAHKERFDASGQGKGIAGREERTDGSGYVQGYKEKDTYAEKK